MQIEDTSRRAKDLFAEVLRDEAVARLYVLGQVPIKRGLNQPKSSQVTAGKSFISKLVKNTLGHRMSSPSLAIFINLGTDLTGKLWRGSSREDIHEPSFYKGRESHSSVDERCWLENDTVIDAGIFYGSLSIVSALSALKILHITGKLGELVRPAEVIAFSDEEGVRFQSTFLGSAAVAGILPNSALQIMDKRGVTQDVLKENLVETGADGLLQLKYDLASVWGYVEVHIEQGPVLESNGFPLAVVKGIAGRSRLKITVRGSQGHAGTVPMSMRQDLMTAAAELIVSLDSLCKHPEDFLSYDYHCKGSDLKSLAGSLVCTVGEISTWPSASNVIPGQASTNSHGSINSTANKFKFLLYSAFNHNKLLFQVTFTVDIHAIDDMRREAIIYELHNQMYKICDRRSVSCLFERKHDANAVMCNRDLSLKLKSAAYTAMKRMYGDIQEDVPELMSGAGHDAMAMSHLTRVGMLFVRCRGGISHSPEEHVFDNDVWAAGLAVLAFLESQM
ncbi:Peptidase M20 [Dillenia turbinata]|uniref:Peptidase M20 n=1 Tax=Dillenia turbinata TaxID=194707 RepID=A0AAN8ZFF3_9MAGN